MAAQSSLFPESQEMRLQKLDSLILHLIMRGPGGPLNLTVNDEERDVLECIRFRRGMKNAVNILEIQKRAKLSARAIKGAVRNLRINFHLPIASWKHSTYGGYYLIVDDADRAAWVKDVTDQVRAEVAALRAAAGPKAGLELLGQLQIELTADGQEKQL